MRTVLDTLVYVRNVIRYRLERLLVRGMYVRLMLMAALVGVVSVIGGALVAGFDPAVQDPIEAVWWAFLRLTDPGYLGEDHGPLRRTVSTVVTVAGYVLFTGALVAILTQWLNQTITELEAGRTRIIARDHIVVLGSTSRTPAILAEMLTAEGRVSRFLELHQTRQLQLAVLVDALSPDVHHELRRQTGNRWREDRVVLRSGSSLVLEHLRRVDFEHASAVLIPSDDLHASEGVADTRIIKTLLSMSESYADMPHHERPLVVTELFDARKIHVVRHAYQGAIEVVATDQLIGRVLALMVLHAGMSEVLEELLAYGVGNEVRVVMANEGQTMLDNRKRLPRGIALGLVRRDNNSFRALLCPPDQMVADKDDRLVVIARRHEDALPISRCPPDAEPLPTNARQTLVAKAFRVIIMGWSDRVPDLVMELSEHHHGQLRVDMLSSVPPATRDRSLADYDFGDTVLTHLEGDLANPAFIRRQQWDQYDSVVFVASDRLRSGAQSDARTIVGYLLVREVLHERSLRPRIAVELLDPSNRPLVRGEGVEVIVSPTLIGRILSHITLRPELRAVYTEMLDAVGCVLALRHIAHYGIAPQAARFDQLHVTVRGAGDRLLGVMPGGADAAVALNPPPTARFELDAKTKLVVLAGTNAG